MQEQARAAARKLKRAINYSVGSGFGFPDVVKGEPVWFLIVQTNDESFQCPDFFDGFKVVKRPIASIDW